MRQLTRQPRHDPYRDEYLLWLVGDRHGRREPDPWLHWWPALLVVCVILLGIPVLPRGTDR